MMEYRMYSMVLTALNPMQKGIQAMHSAMEYVNRHYGDAETKQWLDSDKTSIILEGGKCLDMTELAEGLNKYRIAFNRFREPDLNDLTTSISLLVPESIYGMTEDEMEDMEGDDFRTEGDKWLARTLSGKRLAR